MTPTKAIAYLKTWIAGYVLELFTADEIGKIFGAIQLLEETIARITEFNETHK